MSEPQVPQPTGDENVEDVVDSAKAALADAEAAADASVAPDVSEVDATATAEPAVEPVAAAKVDADAAAFEEAERAFPGTFGGTFTPQPPVVEAVEEVVVEETVIVEDAPAEIAPAVEAEEAPVATVAYAAADAAPTQIVASEPTFVPPVSPQPIFVQAPEAPRERGNRGTAGAIGLLAALSFAILYLGAALGFGAIAGNVTGENILSLIVEQVTSVGFWFTVVIFFLSFWLLGAIINRGRWGHWAIFGLFVGFATYGGHLLSLLIEAPFWTLTAEAGTALITSQLLAPMAIVAFIAARELTMWFGAWVARSGARKTVLNAEAQREYERTLEAGPQLPY